jgi:hypothetical protein
MATVSQGLKPFWLGVAIVRAKARTYLRDKDKGNGKSERRSRFPEGMTERKARARTKATADSRRDDSRKSKGNGKGQCGDLSTPHHKDKGVMLRSR